MEALQSPATAPAKDRMPAHASRGDQVARAIVIAIAISVAPLLCMHMSYVSDADVWWHMRSGQLVLQNHAIPHTDPFASFGAGMPWAAYSWLFDVLVLKCFQTFGLAGIVAYSTGMVLAIAAALYHLIKRLQPDLTITAGLIFIAGFSLMRLYTPRSWLFSILFFALQLDILMHARGTGKTRELLWLPILYAPWANLHIQFFDGLAVLALALGESILSRWLPSIRSRLSPAWMGSIFAACVLVTFANPFGWHIYAIGYRAASQPGTLQLITEFHALAFRALPDYLMLFLALAAAASITAPRAQSGVRRIPLFETGLLAFAAIISFRCGRDMWVMVIAASALIAQFLGDRTEHAASKRVSANTKEIQLSPLAFVLPIIAVTIGILLFLGSRAMRVNNAHLSKQVADRLPVRAVQVAKTNGYAGPLFNDFDWGGYLIWELRMPVSMDGRADFYGDKRIERSFATWGGQPGWASDPELQSAGLVIGSAAAPLTQLLRADPRFELAYQDKMAAVFIARRLHETPTMQAASQ